MSDHFSAPIVTSALILFFLSCAASSSPALVRSVQYLSKIQPLLYALLKSQLRSLHSGHSLTLDICNVHRYCIRSNRSCSGSKEGISIENIIGKFSSHTPIFLSWYFSS